MSGRMNAAEFTQELLEDIIDLITIAERRNESTRRIDDVFKDLKINA